MKENNPATFNTLKKLVDVKGFSQPLTLQQLRFIENGAATQVQKIIRGKFTRKWYQAYMKRKRFGVPFSGIEIIQYPFLRQFAKLNMDLHSEFKRDDEKKGKLTQDKEVDSEYQKLLGNLIF